ncbi:MAG: CYTH domain-containing protein [Nanoarchaeota archaeon]
MTNNIEVEIRSFITKQKYEELITLLTKEGELLSEDYQETYYFDSEEDLRIQKNNFFSKVWMKKGKIHDEAREEIEIKFSKDDFEKAEKLFLGLGYKVKIKWFRNRHTFKWQNIEVMIDYTKGYGHIIEMEIMTSEENKESAIKTLKEKMNQLKIPLTTKEEFEKRFNDYKENWEELIKS